MGMKAAQIAEHFSTTVCMFWIIYQASHNRQCPLGGGVVFGLQCPLTARRIQKRLKKLFKRYLLLGGKQVDVAFVVEQEGADADDCPCQIAGAGYTLFNLMGSFVYQGFQQGQVYLHMFYSIRFSVRFAPGCVPFG